MAATMPSQAHAGAAQEAPDIGQWEGQDVPLVRPSSCNVKGGIPSSRRYLPTYEKDEFVARVMDLIADQYDGPVGSDPPTWDFPRMGAGSAKNSADAANFRRLLVGSAPHDDEDGISDEETSDS